jgi:hypothetical protein
VDALSQITNSKSVKSCASTLSIAWGKYRAVLWVGMQTLILGMVSNSYSWTQMLSDSRRHFAPALHRLETPVIPPLAESTAGVKSDRLHPRVDGAEARLPIEIEYYVRIGDVDLVFYYDAIRALQNTSAHERIDDTLD